MIHMAEIHKKAEKGAVKEKVAKAPKAEKKKEMAVESKPKIEEKKETKAEVSKPAAPKIDAWAILKTPYLTEKSTRMIESQNKLVFLVKERATKQEIKQAVEAEFNVKVRDVNTTSTMKGEKKAYVRLKPEFKAIDIATKLGMM